MSKNTQSRRSFMLASSIAAGALPLHAIIGSEHKATQTDDNINEVGPKEGYTPQVGTLVSMMNWMRNTVLRSVRGLSVSELDYLHDEDSNSIGAMLLHLAATEKYYQLNTFDKMSWGSWDAQTKSEWDTPMSLGERGRQMIKGNPLDYYLEKLDAVRQVSLTKLAELDDEWILYTDQSWGWGPTNNYCKWFHVVEHESNHNGQIKYIKSRIS